MRWLEDYRDDTERRVRDALDAAASRNDNLALRRVWSRLADLVPGAGRRRLRWPVLFTLGGLAAAAVAGLLVLRPLVNDAPHRWPSTLSATTTKVPPAPVPAAPATAPAVEVAPVPDVSAPGDPTPVVLGPATVRTGAREGRALRLKSGARVDLRARTTLVVDAGQRPVLRRGRARLVVPKQPPGETFSVAAGPYVVVVVGTKFNLGVTTRQVSVDVREGIVEVWRGGHMIRLHAGGSWKGPARMGRSIRPRLAPPGRPQARVAPLPDRTSSNGLEQSPSDAYREAQAALDWTDTAIGLSMLRQLAETSGPSAENASYRIGQVQRDQLFQPRQAIVTWSRYRERFPQGVLRHEADFSIIETLLTLGDRATARLEVEAFLRRHPRSERYAQVKAIAATLAASAGGGGSAGGSSPAMRAN